MSRKRVENLYKALSYRMSMTVKEVVHFSMSDSTYSVCPRCKRTLEREYQRYCDRCGQALNWDNLDDAAVTEK